MQKKMIPSYKKQSHLFAVSAIAKKSIPTLEHLAFKNSLQPHIIASKRTGEILLVNNATCKLFGYSDTELLASTCLVIFNIDEKGFKNY